MSELPRRVLVVGATGRLGVATARALAARGAHPEADADPLRTHRLAARSPLGRFGTPTEVVHAVLSLLDATWATGEIWGIGR